MGTLREVRVPVPPLERQQHYGRIATHIHNWLRKLKQSEDEAERLAHSLAHIAFQE
jgi:restriction endonuclease S subunit